MSTPPEHLAPAARAVWAELAAAYKARGADVTGPTLDALANLVALERDTAGRFFTEGTIVSDEHGAPIPHPALAVHRNLLPQVITLEKYLDEKATPAEDDDDPFGGF